ncbi:GspH/FimT family pseudopilin [Chromatium okenii]|uniref:GspH/FimT family pseudopilin n=1 Tax=Chromatium okenii TaxID=61644 RepID=UPI0026E97F9C|nr:GspH/FimT family pseudopilin [Chromatium okenii]
MKTQRGTTLMELMITLSIAAILMSIAVPSFQTFTRTNRIAAATNALSSALQFARSEAVTRGKMVSVCPSTNTETATPTCTAGASLTSGWLVFVDDGTRLTVDGTDVRLRVGMPSVAALTIEPAATLASGISYGARGDVFKDPAETTATNRYINLTIDTENRCILINFIGRVRIKPAACTPAEVDS